MWLTAAEPRRVLIVDDVPDAANSLGLIVHALGHEVAVANDAVTAIGLARQQPPDVVLMDINLPDMDGAELARRLRQLPDCRDALMIAVSGDSDEFTRQRVRQAGIDDYFVKPADPELLSRRILQGPPLAG